MDNLGEVLRKAREKKGLSLASVAGGLGFGASWLSRIEKNQNNIKPQDLVALCEAIGVDKNHALELLMQKGASDPVSVAEQPAVVSTVDATDYQTPPRADAEGLVLVPSYSVDASAGHGALVDDEPQAAPLAFRRDWLRTVTATPADKLAVIRVRGDSMFPTLANGDVILVDRTYTQPHGDGIYVVRYGDCLLVKRVRIDPFRRLVTITSDNPAYPPIEALPPDSVAVAGRVIWLGREV